MFVVALAPAALALNVAAAAPSPDVSPTVTPTSTPTPLSLLEVRKTDLSGVPIPAAGVTFEIHQGSPDGEVVATIATAAGGVATARLLPGRYCVKEASAPPGFQLAPSYTPRDGCNAAPGVISAADPPAATPTPTAAPTQTPPPTPAPIGELLVTKTDTGGQAITTPGFTFNVHVGSATGQVVATIATDSSGTAVAGALNPATYCVEEISAPDGFQVAPTYSPSACVAVAADSTRGRSPTTVTVADPAAATPSPTAPAAAVPSPSPSAPRGTPAPASTPSGLPLGTLSGLLIGFGVLLLAIGAVMIVLAIRRRRLREPEPPPDIWYDSTIS